VLLAVTTSHPAYAITATPTPSDDPAIQHTSLIKFDPMNPDAVEAKVRQEFADIPVMISIAKCESSFTQYDTVGNPMYGGSGGMVGVFQVAASVHNDAAKDLNLNITTLEGNLAYARHLYETEGTVPWLASASCWNPRPLSGVLKIGSKGKQVKLLQETLNKLGYTIAANGEGSPGQESTLFGPMTREAVKKFQCATRITCSGSENTSGYGVVGTKTRLALLKLDAKLSQTESANNLSRK
jgi:hypothetical protein